MADDLSIFLALMSEGTTGRAAERVRCSQPTVVRRIAALEEEIGITLFERSPQGYVPTAEARALEASAVEVARARQSFDDLATSLVESREVAIGVTFLDDFRRQLLPALRSFAERWPEVRVDLIPSYEMVDLLRGDAEIALRGRIAPEGEAFIVRELPTPGWGLYVARGQAKPPALGAVEPLRAAGLSGPTGRLHPFELLRQQAGGSLIEYPSYSALVSAIASGAAISALPIAMGDPEPELERAFLFDEEGLPPIFLVGRRSALRRRPVRDLFDTIAESFHAQRANLTGRPD
ncbi:LysR family transcriptional regulator [Sphingomicrobium arenosum]|uniref:LysR family transcriptional regulator n=1 Tax=Sphingomicrobium arenosum TaxID=2233861 RepID=UPI00223F8291|nr:LysR family transcriptional regulator [Sphingomicrobium arenosum]